MAQQPLLALQVKPVQTPTYGDIMQEQDAYRAQQNAFAQQQMKQQQNAMLNQAYRAAYDPQTGRVDQAKLYGRLAEGGMGAEIPGQMEALGKGVEASGKGGAAQVKYAQELLAFSRNELGSAQTPQEAMAAGARIAQQFPEAAPNVQQQIAQLQNMTPEQFGAWKMDALRKNLSAEQRLKQHFQTQNLGGSTRVLAMPEYGGGGATVVPGSDAKVTMSPAQANPAGRVVQGADGKYYLVNTRTAGAAPVTVGGGGIPGERGGGGAPALATNPGALKDGAFARSQPGYAGASGAFATFETPEAGVRAQENLLRSAYVGKGFNTISKIVDRYAPQGPENSPASVSNYKQYIAQQTGIDVNSPISAGQVPAVAQAMREFETGQRPGGRAPAAGAAPGQLQGPAKGGKAATDDKAAKALAEFEASVDKQIAQIDRLVKHKGLPYITGSFRGRAPGIVNAMPSVDIGNYRIGGGGQDADDAQALLEAIQANATLTELQKLKQSGTSLGQVAVYEDKMLGAAAAVTKQTQGTETMRASLLDYKRLLLESKKRIREEAAKGAAGASTAAPQRKPLDAFKRR